MGSIVKSIGKAIKKVGKGIAKVVKKIWPVLLVAAAVYTGVAFYGSTLATASGATLGTSNFMGGLGAIGKSVAGFFSPAGSAAAGTAPVAGAGYATTAAGQYGTAMSGAAGIVPTMGEQTAAQIAGGNVLGEFATKTAVTPGSATAFMGNAALTNATKQSIVSSYTSAVAGGMSSGDALVYMTKMNMLATGAKMVAGFLDDSEEKQMQHDKELLSMKYAYGKPMTPEQKAWKAENPNWIREHPAIASTQRPPMTSAAANMFGSQAMVNHPSQTTPPPPYVQQQNIGQPTFGRGPARQAETPATRAMVSKGPGLITKGTQGRFNPTQQRYS